MGNTMLIVDDDAINRGLLSLIFSPHYHIQEAEDGPRGLRPSWTAPSGCARCCWMWSCPAWTGWRCCERLTGQDASRETLPVFLITAEASGQVMQAAYRWGSWM